MLFTDSPADYIDTLGRDDVPLTSLGCASQRDLCRAVGMREARTRKIS